MTGAQRSKYNVDLADKEKRTFEGIVFDSMGEMKMYRDYLLPQLHDGIITEIQRQVTYELQEGFTHEGKKERPITYVADFVVTYADGKTTVYDFKGMPDSLAKIKRKLFWYKYPDIDFQWMAYSKIDGGYVPYEAVAKGRKERAKARKLKEK